jgi:hypothetical protein
MAEALGRTGHIADAHPGGCERHPCDAVYEIAANPLARVFYVGSSALCVPHSISEGGAALGAQAGPARLIGAFRDAGFTSAKVAIATASNLVIQATV